MLSTAEAPAAPRRRQWFDGRWLVAVLVPLHVALFFQLSPQMDTVGVARTWGILTQRPLFSDAYVIPAAKKTREAGGDPYRANPFDPWQRPLNYPPAWLWFSGSDVSAAAVRTQALAVAAASLGAFLLFLGPLTISQGLLAAAFGCSPIALLAVERGNNDQLIFALVALSLVVLRNASRASLRAVGYGGVGLAAALKLYPLAAFAVMLRERGSLFRRFVVFAAALTLGCLALNAPYLPALGANTPSGGLHSYGSSSLGFWIAFFGGAEWQIDGQRLVVVGRVLALALIAIAARRALKSARGTPSAADSAGWDGLRAGGAIYVGTFVLGSNFDYRLLFLGLCLPALFHGLSGDTGERRHALATLIAIGLTVWPNGLFWKPLLFVKLAGSWALLFLLAHALVRTLPARTKDATAAAQ